MTDTTPWHIYKTSTEVNVYQIQKEIEYNKITISFMYVHICIIYSQNHLHPICVTTGVCYIHEMALSM